MKTVGIIEDEAALAKSIAANLEMEGFCPHIFESAESYLDKQDTFQLDIILVDRNLPGKDGLSLVKETRDKHPSLPILFVTAEIDSDSVVEGFQVGADDYIRKPFSTKELIERMKKVLRLRQALQAPPSSPLWQIHQKSREFEYKNKKVRLTQTELEITEILMKSCNEVIERKALSELFSHVDSSNSRTLDVHISAVRKKVLPLGLKLETIRGIGYRVLALPE